MDQRKGKLFVIAAPSGAGKTTVVQKVIARLSPTCSLERVITYTTKQPRPGERQAIDYHFLEEDDFKRRIAQGFFIEHSTAYGAYYGFPKEIFSMLAGGKSYIGIVDMAGAAAIRAYSPEAVLIGIEPPDQHILEQRLVQRAEDSPSAIAFRMGLLKNELTYLQGDFFTYIIENCRLEDAVQRLEEIITQELSNPAPSR